MKVGILTRLVKFGGFWLIVIPLIAMMIAAYFSNTQRAITGYQKASASVAFYGGVATWTIPHLVQVFTGSKTYVDNSVNGQSTVPKLSGSKTSGSSSATTTNKFTAQQLSDLAKKSCANEPTAKARSKCESDFIKVATQ